MNATIRAMIRETDDRYYDPWGTLLRHGFAIGEVLSAPDCDGQVPAEMSYVHGAYRPLTFADFLDDDARGSGEWYYEAEYVRALESSEITVADIEHAARVISRYLDCPAVKARSY